MKTRPRTLLIVLFVLEVGLCARDVRSQVTDGGMKESLPGSDPSGEATIDGRVVLPSGRSVAGILKVTLEKGSNAIRTVYTDTTGVFHIGTIMGGEYSVRAYGDDRFYLPGNQELLIKPGASVQLVIYLREKPTSSTGKAGVVSAEDWDRLAPRDAKKDYDKAEKMIGKGDIDGGIEELRQALSLYQDYASARNELGVQYLKRNELAQASEQFEYILGKAPTYFEAKFNLGLVRLQQQRYKDAVTELTSATSIDGSNAGAHLWLGVARLETADLPAAEQEMARAQALGGLQLPATHYYLGQVYLRQNRTADACKQFQEYLSISATGDLATDSRRILQKCSSKPDQKQ
ncbi:MAG TPA: tetratricopeptide repeat protein [Blastocatellia bacterium]